MGSNNRQQQEKVAVSARTCGHCAAFVPPPVATAGRDETAARAAGVDKGVCHLLPTAVSKRPEDFCLSFTAKEGKPHA